MAGRMQGAYPPPAPARRPGNSGLLLWSLIGCGVIALLLVVIAGVMLSKGLTSGGSKGIFSVVSAIPSAAESVQKVGTGIAEYRKDNSGKFPPSLDALVPKYVADKSAFVCGNADDPRTMEYVPPKADAPESTVVVRVHVGDIVMPNQRQQMYVLLLKNGEVDSEQQARTVLNKAGKNAFDHAAEPKRTY